MTFRAKYEEGWAKDQGIWAGPSMDFPPDKPTTYHKIYDPDSVIDFVPAPPEPYETFEEDL